jgi:predicted HTH domain antitoxin
MGQRRGELEDQEYQEQLRRESEMREATAVEQYAQRLIDVMARVRLGIKRGGKAREQDVKRPREE